MNPAGSKALRRLPPYPFAALEEKARAVGAEPPLLGFAIGDPDIPPPEGLLDAARRALEEPGSHRYSSSRGEAAPREAFARWFERRFGVRVDPATEVAILIGSKEGIAGLPRAILEPRDRVGVPDPGYPAYGNAVRLARMRPVPFPLTEGSGWRPDWSKVPEGIRLLYLNYPNNPTGAVVSRDELAPAIDLARDHRFTIAYDNAYSEITFAGPPAPSILELPGARDVAIEFHSLSKTLGVPGWRIGFAVGNAEIVGALVDLKSHGDSGAANPFQRAASRLLADAAERSWPPEVPASIAEYGERLRTLAAGLRAIGVDVAEPKGTLYLWHRAPGGNGARWADRLLTRAHVLVTPGGAFGRGGRPYVRWSVTAPTERIREAVDRLGRLGKRP